MTSAARVSGRIHDAYSAFQKVGRTVRTFLSGTWCGYGIEYDRGPSISAKSASSIKLDLAKQPPEKIANIDSSIKTLAEYCVTNCNDNSSSFHRVDLRHKSLSSTNSGNISELEPDYHDVLKQFFINRTKEVDNILTNYRKTLKSLDPKECDTHDIDFDKARAETWKADIDSKLNQIDEIIGRATIIKNTEEKSELIDNLNSSKNYLEKAKIHVELTTKVLERDTIANNDAYLYYFAPAVDFASRYSATSQRYLKNLDNFKISATNHLGFLKVARAEHQYNQRQFNKIRMQLKEELESTIESARHEIEWATMYMKTQAQNSD